MASTTDGRPESRRPPSKRASAALLAACRADYQQGRGEEASRPPDPFKYTPLLWEWHQRNDTGGSRGRR